MSRQTQYAGSARITRNAAMPDGASRIANGRASPVSSLKNQSVIRAFAILKSFYSPDEWVQASELSRRARIHEATVNRFMQSLLDVGAVVRDDRARYRCVLFMMPGTHGHPFGSVTAPPNS